MSYEGDTLKRFAMPTQKAVEQMLLRSLLKHGGIITEFASGEDIVDELADEFHLNSFQRSAVLETVVRKENRVKKSRLWHRLLFRAGDSLAKESLVSRPTQTFRITNKKEWMLTEKGFDRALNLSGIPVTRKESLHTKSFEVQKVVKRLLQVPDSKTFNPFDLSKRIVKTSRESVLRTRGFRQAVIEAYSYKCAVCGLSIRSPDSISWEVQAAHIVPNSSFGRDDLRNGIALCGLHHWAFDVGWFTLLDDYQIRVSGKLHTLPTDAGRLWGIDCFRLLCEQRTKIYLPEKSTLYPHYKAIAWHRENVFH